jgi:hypothetical protein
MPIAIDYTPPPAAIWPAPFALQNADLLRSDSAYTLFRALANVADRWRESVQVLHETESRVQTNVIDADSWYDINTFLHTASIPVKPRIIVRGPLVFPPHDFTDIESE